MTRLNETLWVADAEGVRTVTINRPDRRNALDTALAAALLEAIRAADRAAARERQARAATQATR